MSKNAAVGVVKWIVALALIGSGGFFGYRYWQKKPKAGPEYRTAPVTRGELIQTVTATGTLNPVVNVQVGSQVSGIIKKIFVDYNSIVTNNQLIAQIDPATFLANMHQAEGELANAKAQLELAQFNFKRNKQLVEEKLIPQSDFDKTMADLHQAEAQVQIRQASLEKSRVDYERTSIYAPIDGVVISRSVDVGQTVAASFNTPTLFLIANDLAKMQIDANVSEADVGGVEVDQEVTFTVDAFPNRTFHGAVTQIRNSPITVQNVVTYDTVIGVNNSDLKLKPGMTANVSIRVAHRENTLRIPNAALRFRPPDSSSDAKKTGITSGGGTGSTNVASASGRGQGGWNRGERGGGGGSGRPRGERQPSRTVYVLSTTGTTNALPELQPVQIKTGITDGTSTEILEGLKEGDQVVVGSTNPEASSTARPAASPFGGGGPGGMRRF